MPRQRYQLAAVGVPVGRRWVRARFRHEGWSQEWPARTAWDTFPSEKPTASGALLEL